MPDQPQLLAENIVAGYGAAPIVRGASLSIAAGALTCVVGPNGAGKSTLLKALAGELRLTDGTIRFRGDDVSRLATDRRVAAGLGYVPQVANVFTTLTVHENLLVGAYRRRARVRARVDEVCALFPDLRAALGRPAGTLSGGQRSMLALSRALMAEPSLLLLDEPTAGLAPLVEQQVWEHILAVRDQGISVLVVEQNTRRALSYAGWAYVMVNGEVVAEGAGPDLLKRRELVDMYLGG
jgi:branched-chain amino acid transport system ATP-binding protein